MKKVSIGVIFYKGEAYLPYMLPSLIDQDYPHIEFLFRDQSPNFEVYEFIKKNRPDIFEKIKIEKGNNRFHSGGHNDLINKMTGDIYVCASYDMIYPSNFVSNIVKTLEKPENQDFGFATCKLMHWDFPLLKKTNNLEKSKTNILDSCGIGLTQSHHFFDIGQGEIDAGQYDRQRSIFGASGALFILRKESLEKIAYQKEYFDELLHYKNDVDLSYRLQWAGIKGLFIPHVRVFHDRQLLGKNQNPGKISTFIQSWRNKKKWEKENSYFGHLVVLEKNFSKNFSPQTKAKTFLQNLLAQVFFRIFEPHTYRQRKEVLKQKNKIENKKNALEKKVIETEIEKFMR